MTSIGDYAFGYCTGLTSITIGNSVTSIGREAFYGCKNLENVYCYAETVPETGNDAFENAHVGFSTLYVPASAIDAYKTNQTAVSSASPVSTTTRRSASTPSTARASALPLPSTARHPLPHSQALSL
ncbi:MAG: leucine-rich repeat domain-containing protein [Prevotella sp.]